MRSYKGWTIKTSASLGFFSSGRGGKVKRHYSAYKDEKSLFAPSVGADTLKELKKKIDYWEGQNFWPLDIF